MYQALSLHYLGHVCLSGHFCRRLAVCAVLHHLLHASMFCRRSSNCCPCGSSQIFGPESSGKTTLALHAIAEVQKKGGNACFIDAEHALDRSYAEVREGLGLALFVFTGQHCGTCLLYRTTWKRTAALFAPDTVCTAVGLRASENTTLSCLRMLADNDMDSTIRGVGHNTPYSNRSCIHSLEPVFSSAVVIM